MHRKKIALLVLFVLSYLSINAQNYTDKQIGLDSLGLVQRLISKGLSNNEIAQSIIIERTILTEYFIEQDAYIQNYFTNNPYYRDSNIACNVPAIERQALIDLYNATDGVNWINIVPWDFTLPVCQWEGVYVSDDNHVIGLSLNNKSLSGTIPDSIGDLTYLETLQLSSNDSLGGIIPSTIGNLINLELIRLSHNNLTGSIPTTIGNLNNLRFLELSANRNTSIGNPGLTGIFPPLLWNLSSLEWIGLTTNSITDEIPSSIENLVNLKKCQLQGNNLNGEIPNSIGNISTLELFNVRVNEIEGTVPATIGNLTNLKGLFISQNELEGTIDSSFSNLINLEWFMFQDNNLEGDIPSFNTNDFIFLSFNNNEYIFSDFETEHIAYVFNTSGTYAFSPQAKVDQVETITVTEGQPITFNTILSSPNNTYTWYKDGNLLEATQSNPYVIPSANESHEGTYYFLATNSVVDGLTLERHPITVIVEPPGNTGDSFCECNSFAPIINKKYILSAWVKEEITSFNPVTPEDLLLAQPLTYEFPIVSILFYDSSDEVIGDPFDFNPTGEIIDGWQRIVGEFTVPEDTFDIGVELINNNPNHNVKAYFDDVRIHPYNGNLKSFVYDSENYRLMAELDENNFATFYEYDSEGGLVRVKKETERGVMTIQETRSGNVISDDN